LIYNTQAVRISDQFTGQTIWLPPCGLSFDILAGVQGSLAILNTAHLTHLVVTVIALVCRIQMLAGRLLIEGTRLSLAIFFSFTAKNLDNQKDNAATTLAVRQILDEQSQHASTSNNYAHECHQTWIS
jgi:hypothetical protein